MRLKIRITAPDGKKIRDIRNDREYSEVICEEQNRAYYVLADSPEDPVVEEMDGVTLGERVSDLEDAVVELAAIITEGDEEDA